MPTFLVSPSADADLEEIAEYTDKHYGRTQAEKYLRNLYDRFQKLAENPLLGRDRSDIKPGYRSAREGSHQIYYIKNDDGIGIIAVLHQAMDAEDRLD
ncbi:MAG: type II toxin-antitoxin system RelE/ParE family toxin [Pseudomonadota bacterium]